MYKKHQVINEPCWCISTKHIIVMPPNPDSFGKVYQDESEPVQVGWCIFELGKDGKQEYLFSVVGWLPVLHPVTEEQHHAWLTKNLIAYQTAIEFSEEPLTFN